MSDFGVMYPSNITQEDPIIASIISTYSPLFLNPDGLFATIIQHHKNPQKLMLKLRALPLKSTTTPPLTNYQIEDIFTDLYQLEDIIMKSTTFSDDEIDTTVIHARVQAKGLIDALNKTNTTDPMPSKPLTFPDTLPPIIPTDQHPRIEGGNHIDILTWERRGNFKFYTQHTQKWCHLTSFVNAGQAKADAKAQSQSFFLRSLYAVARAANEIKQFRYRIDNQGRVILWDKIDIIAPIASPLQNATFVTLRFKYNEDFKIFIKDAKAQIAAMDPSDDPYAADHQVEKEGKNDVILLSVIRNLFFTGLTCSTLKSPQENCLFPLVAMGKHDDMNGKNVIPMSLYFGHHLMDGDHVAQFNQCISTYLQDPYAESIVPPQ